jgi:hypothetical protein
MTAAMHKRLILLGLLAIGDAVILGSDSHDAGWPGGHFIWYRLLNGSHAGDT